MTMISLIPLVVLGIGVALGAVSTWLLSLLDVPAGWSALGTTVVVLCFIGMVLLEESKIPVPAIRKHPCEQCGSTTDRHATWCGSEEHLEMMRKRGSV